MKREELESKLADLKLTKFLPCFEPATVLTPEPVPIESLAIGASRFGGVPDLPGDFPWPEVDDVPLQFLAQLDLAAISAAAPESTPIESGWLLFFANTEEVTDNYAPNEVVAYAVHQIAAGTALERRGTPDGIEEFPCCRLVAEENFDLGNFDPSAVDGPPNDEELEGLGALLEDQAEGEWRETFGVPHQLFGKPHSIQGEVDEEAFEMHRKRLKLTDPNPALLLQVASDDRAGFMWGDAGALYFMIQVEDFEAGRFDRTLLAHQCF